MTVKAILATSTALVTWAGMAQAADVAALIGDDTLAIVDTSAKKATKKMKVEGITGPLVGIDVRPADGMLYALAADGTLYTIAMDGKATQVARIEGLGGAVTDIAILPKM